MTVKITTPKTRLNLKLNAPAAVQHRMRAIRGGLRDSVDSMKTVQGDLYRSSLEALRTGLLKGRVMRTAAFFEDSSGSSEQPEWNLPMRLDLRRTDGTWRSDWRRAAGDLMRSDMRRMALALALRALAHRRDTTSAMAMMRPATLKSTMTKRSCCLMLPSIGAR